MPSLWSYGIQIQDLAKPLSNIRPEQQNVQSIRLGQTTGRAPWYMTDNALQTYVTIYKSPQLHEVATRHYKRIFSDRNPLISCTSSITIPNNPPKRLKKKNFQGTPLPKKIKKKNITMAPIGVDFIIYDKIIFTYTQLIHLRTSFFSPHNRIDDVLQFKHIKKKYQFYNFLVQARKKKYVQLRDLIVILHSS